jgi:hypothetical protein
MFGTIGHFKPRAGHEDQVRDLFAEWVQTQRPTLPGLVVGLVGKPINRPDEIMEVVLMQDEETYRALAASPAQDAWYQRLMEHLSAEPTWDDIAWEGFQADVLSPSQG